MEEKTFVAGNFYNKYESKNSFHNFLVNNYLKSFRKALKSYIGKENPRILEIGCGEGYLLKEIRETFNEAEIFACDLSSEKIEEATEKHGYLRVNFFKADAHNVSRIIDSKFDLLICCEVLEHLENPDQAISDFLNLSDRLVLSVPNEPLWRILNCLRGSYLKDFGNTPGHLNHWSLGSFKKFVERSGWKVKNSFYPLPWQFVYAEKAK